MQGIPSGAKVLTQEDYREYEAFWRKCNPGCRDTEWLREYFDEMAQNHICICVYADDMLVSCTDAPDMPPQDTSVVCGSRQPGIPQTG